MCPRGANPGDVLKAVRKMNIEENAWPSFLGKLAGEPALAVVTVGIPAIVVLLLTYFSNGFNFSGPTPINYGKFIGYIPIQIIYTATLIFAAVSLIMSLRKYWNRLETSSAVAANSPRRDFIPSFIEALQEILPHTTFRDCQANNLRYAAHLMTFWGFIGLLVTTAIVAFNIDILHLAPPSQNGPGTVPIKILGNVSAVAFVLGLLIMLVRRMTVPEQAGNSSYFDWLFLFFIVGTGVTGLLTELCRWGGSTPATYFFYMIHLMFVLGLLLYLPFSKFAHLGYRTIAIAWGKSVGRNMTIPTRPNYTPPSVAEAQKSV
jgi:quinone-modifying oxidoreductase subunit QmoC